MKYFWAWLRKFNKVFYSDQFGLILAGWLMGHAYHGFRDGHLWFGVISVALSVLIGVWAWRGLEKAMRKAVRP